MIREINYLIVRKTSHSSICENTHTIIRRYIYSGIRETLSLSHTKSLNL